MKLIFFSFLFFAFKEVSIIFKNWFLNSTSKKSKKKNNELSLNFFFIAWREMDVEEKVATLLTVIALDYQMSIAKFLAKKLKLKTGYLNSYFKQVT